jgi:hypothetical protein
MTKKRAVIVGTAVFFAANDVDETKECLTVQDREA